MVSLLMPILNTLLVNLLFCGVDGNGHCAVRHRTNKHHSRTIIEGLRGRGLYYYPVSALLFTAPPCGGAE